MGAGASASATLDAEVAKPRDASDCNTPRGVSARAEVVRLRAMLSMNLKSARMLGGAAPPEAKALEREISKPGDASDLMDSPEAAKDEVRRAASNPTLRPHVRTILLPPAVNGC